MTRPLHPRPHVRVPAHVAAAATLALRGVDTGAEDVALEYLAWRLRAEGHGLRWARESGAVRMFCAAWEAGEIV